MVTNVADKDFAFDLLQWCADASFRDLCMKHDELCRVACEYSQAKEIKLFWRASNACRVVKATMWLEHPKGAAAWFEKEHQIHD